jgi:hypothetical protein
MILWKTVSELMSESYHLDHDTESAVDDALARLKGNDFLAEISYNRDIMDGPILSAETPKADVTKMKEAAPAVVFQPQKLKEIVEVVDLMGTVAARGS